MDTQRSSKSFPEKGLRLRKTRVQSLHSDMDRYMSESARSGEEMTRGAFRVW